MTMTNDELRALADALDGCNPYRDSSAVYSAAAYLRAQADAQPVAWMHIDGRVISAATMDQAYRDGGAMQSSLREYTIPLYTHPAPAAPQAEPIDPHMIVAEDRFPDEQAEPDGLTPKEAWWAGVRVGLRLPPDTPRERLSALLQQAEPKREPSAAEWLSTDDAETHLAAAMRDAARIAPPSDDKAILDALKRRGIWLAQIGGIERLTAENLHLRQSATVSVSSTLHDAALAELNGEIERLTAERDEARAERDAMAKQGETLQALVDACKLLSSEAEEYEFDDGLGRGALLDYWYEFDRKLDAAIDAQIEQEKNSGSR